MINVLVIAPYPGLAQLINTIKDDLPEFNISVLLGDLNESIKLIESVDSNDFDLIISRGGTAELIRSHTQIPVLNIEISGHDILRVLTLLKNYDNESVALIGFKDVIKSFESISYLLDMNIKYIEIKEENEVKESLNYAQKNNINIIVGDTITVRLANEMGLQGVLITSGKESILKTFKDAKTLHKELNKYHRQLSNYDKLFNKLPYGVVIYNNNGDIYFENTFSTSIFNFKKSKNIYHLLKFLKKIKYVSDDSTVIYQLSLGDFESIYSMDIIKLDDTTNCLHLKCQQNSKSLDNIMRITFNINKKNMLNNHFVKYGILSEKIITNAQNTFNNKKPLCIVGEKGTGKHALIGVLSDGNNYSINISCNTINTKSFNQYYNLLKYIDHNTIIHFEEIQKLSNTQQNRVYSLVKEKKNKFSFSFVSNYEDIINNTFKINTDLHTLLIENIIFLKALRDRKKDLENLIQSYIIFFNEQFGKQIVGFRPDVLDHFLNYPWYGNFHELYKTMRTIIENTATEFIEQNSVNFLNQSFYTDSNQFILIDVNQTLDEIENDIIQQLLKQNNMNQTKVAELLGINRSTLWRKIRSTDN